MIVLKIVFCIINCIFIKTVFFYQKLYFAAKNVFVFWLKDSVLCINKLYFVSRCICYQKLYLNQNVFCIKNCILPQKCICKKIFSVSKIFGSKSVFCVKNCLLCQKFYFVSKYITYISGYRNSIPFFNSHNRILIIHKTNRRWRRRFFQSVHFLLKLLYLKYN